MFGIKNIVRFFGGKRSKKASAPIIKEPKAWIELGENSDDSDFVVIPKDAYKKEYNAQQLSVKHELFAKSEAYKLAVPLTDNADRALAAEKRLNNQGYTVKKLGTDAARGQGINLYALVNEQDANAPITVVCRGTQLDASIIADLDPTGPGYTQVRENLDVILQQLNELSVSRPGAKLRITGHSLGGSLAQALTKEVLAVKRQALQGATAHTALGQISGIDTVVFQSAGVSEQVIKTAKKDLEQIKSRFPNFEMNFIANVKKGDFVSRTGKYLFADVAPELADVSLLLRNLDKSCITLGDAAGIGSVAMAGNPVWLALSAVKTFFSRAIKNRLAAHSDFFHHEKDKHGLFKLINGKSYGLYSNSNLEDRAKIQRVFEKDLIANLPYSHEMQTAAFNALKDLNNQEVQGMVESGKASLTLANVVAEVAVVISSGSTSATLVCGARNIGNVSTSVENLQEHCNGVKNGFLKMFGIHRNNADTLATIQQNRVLVSPE